MPLNPTTGPDIQSYENGRAQARYNGVVPLAVPPPQGTATWWSNTGTLDVWNGIPSRTGTEPIWRGNGGAELAPKVDASGNWIGGGTPPRRLDLANQGQPQPGTPNQQGPVYRNRPAPAYVPRNPNPQGQVYIPPPPLPLPPVVGVTKTLELYGVEGGRKVPLLSILKFDGTHYVLNPAHRGRIAIGGSAAEGFGYGGTPGRWNTLYPSDSPAVFGLDPNIGIIAWDGRKAWAVPANTLVEIWGPNWRDSVYRV